MILLTYIIYRVYLRYKNSKETQKQYSFLSINDKLNSQRQRILSLINYYDISLIIKDSWNFFIEMKIHFHLKQAKNLEQKNLFLDYFNFGKILNF